jgi:hypothetical protein
MPRCARKGCRRWRPAVLIRAAALGLRLDEDWYCSAECLGTAVRHRLAKTTPIVAPATASSAQPRLGGVLATQKRLAPGVVEQAASVQARTGLRIGTQLIALGVVTKLDVLRALAAQSGIGFLTSIDPGRLAHAPGSLSPAVVRALGVVPFETDRRHDVLKVACTAPVPRGSLAALRELTGSIIEPYLVADDLWPAVLQAYGAGGTAPTLVADLETLAGRIAEKAREAGSVRMSEARCNDNLWVRLDAGDHVEELLLTAPVARPVEQNVLRPVAVEAAARPRRVKPPRPARPRTRRPETPATTTAEPVAQPIAVAARAPEPPPPPAAAPETVDPGMDLSFLDAWDARDVPLVQQ